MNSAKEKTKKNLHIVRRWFFEPSYLPLIVSAMLTVLFIRNIYTQNQGLLKDKLRERLVAIASTAALQFDSNEISKIHSPMALYTPGFKHVIEKLNSIKNKTVFFIMLIFRNKMFLRFL